jgi:8-hydroxy-5-deazaflavin:NADPH oxidoreductase
VKKSIGIIGSGGLGGNVARVLAKNGISATISNNRGPDSLKDFIKEVGPTIKAGKAAEAAAADIVLVAVRWESLPQLFSEIPALKGRIVIDGTNPVEFLDPNAPKDPTNPLAAYGIKAIDLGGRHSSSVFREFVPGAHVVKALNHLDVNVLNQPVVSGGQRVQFFAGDDAASKNEVRKLLESMGYFAIDLGTLDAGGPLSQLPFGPLSATHFIKI